MKVTDFDYNLPEELIAQTPLKQRDASRMMVLNRSQHTIENKHFYDIIDYLQEGDVLVRNNTKVIPARLFGVKKDTGARVEVLLLSQEGDNWECLVGNARAVKKGSVIIFDEKLLQAECVEVKDEGIRVFHMIYQGIFYEILDKLGNTPLPPYIKERLEDKDRYQTVYAKVEGSAAAPTAGFHFTNELFEKIKAKGITVLDITLHVGLGTFRPVGEDNVEDHPMHSEYYSVTKDVAEQLNKAKAEHRRIISVGTTTTRTLEAVYKKYGRFEGGSATTNIFIYPGFKFQAIDALITNFHLPKSTLIMLVSAFASREFILQAYEEAVALRYRFFSFGDAMFIY